MIFFEASLLPMVPLFEFCSVVWLCRPELLPVFLSIRFCCAEEGVELFCVAVLLSVPGPFGVLVRTLGAEPGLVT